jgi:hypothetical protein
MILGHVVKGFRGEVAVPQLACSRCLNPCDSGRAGLVCPTRRATAIDKRGGRRAMLLNLPGIVWAMLAGLVVFGLIPLIVIYLAYRYFR